MNKGLSHCFIWLPLLQDLQLLTFMTIILKAVLKSLLKNLPSVLLCTLQLGVLYSLSGVRNITEKKHETNIVESSLTVSVL